MCRQMSIYPIFRQKAVRKEGSCSIDKRASCRQPRRHISSSYWPALESQLRHDMCRDTRPAFLHWLAQTMSVYELACRSRCGGENRHGANLYLEVCLLADIPSIYCKPFASPGLTFHLRFRCIHMHFALTVLSVLLANLKSDGFTCTYTA